MVLKIWKLAAILSVIALYALINAPHLWTQTDFTTSPQGVTFHTEVTVQAQEDKTTGTNIVNPTATLDTSQVDDNDDPRCSTDTDCVTKHPDIIPDGYTAQAYFLVWGDNVHFPTKGDCTEVDWLSVNEDGRYFVPLDKNHDGAIDCNSDVELGR